MFFHTHRRLWTHSRRFPSSAPQAPPPGAILFEGDQFILVAPSLFEPGRILSSCRQARTGISAGMNLLSCEEAALIADFGSGMCVAAFSQ